MLVDNLCYYHTVLLLPATRLCGVTLLVIIYCKIIQSPPVKIVFCSWGLLPDCHFDKSQCIRYLYERKDVFLWLTTAFGKLLCYKVLPFQPWPGNYCLVWHARQSVDHRISSSYCLWLSKSRDWGIGQLEDVELSWWLFLTNNSLVLSFFCRGSVYETRMTQIAILNASFLERLFYTCSILHMFSSYPCDH